VTLVIGVSVLFLVYALAQLLGLRLLTQILQTGAVVGLFALVVVFQPELRRALERIGRVGSFHWLRAPADRRAVERVAHEVSHAAGLLAADGVGALVVLERETGLGEIAETGVELDAELSTDLLRTLFTPRAALHDGAVIIRGERVLAAGALLPLAETSVQSERFGTRHRAALGITEQTDAVVVVVSEENQQISLVERGRIVRALSETQLDRALRSLLDPAIDRRGRLRWSGLGRNGHEPTATVPASPGARPAAARSPATDGRPTTDGPPATDGQPRAESQPRPQQQPSADPVPAAAPPAPEAAAPERPTAEPPPPKRPPAELPAGDGASTTARIPR
jgi:diadenylate cyclase